MLVGCTCWSLCEAATRAAETLVTTTFVLKVLNTHTLSLSLSLLLPLRVYTFSVFVFISSILHS
jgi:hypothetical protein